MCISFAHQHNIRDYCILRKSDKVMYNITHGNKSKLQFYVPVFCLSSHFMTTLCNDVDLLKFLIIKIKIQE